MRRLPVEPPDAPPPTADAPRSRRAFLRPGSLAAMGSVAGTVGAPAPEPAAAQPPKRLRGRTLARRFAGVDQSRQPAWIVEPTDGWTSMPLRLARRITYGLTPEVIARANALGYEGYLDEQLDPEAIDDAAAQEFVAAAYPLLARSGPQLYGEETGDVFQQLQEGTLYRAAFSRRQLYERMVEFWSDHFSIWVREVTYLKILDDRDVIRKHALGTFPDLLRASAQSPAMLVYLDQHTSRRGAPNQNYARELLELHTMGVDGGYTQQDVAELSRALTGWTIQGRGGFAFNPSLHDFDGKTILGRPIPAMPRSAGAAGVEDGHAVLEWLIDHPSTARFVARKMLRWLLWYEPTAEMIDRVAGVYTATRGAIRPMVRACLDPSYVVQAPAKLKRPYHYLVSAMRGLAPTTLTTVTAVNRQLTTLGQQLFMWETPDGYPDQVEYWVGNLVPRWNLATLLTTTQTPEYTVDVAPLVALQRADAIVQEIDHRVFGGELQSLTREQLTAYLRSAPLSAARVRETLALAFSSAEFQWY